MKRRSKYPPCHHCNGRARDCFCGRRDEETFGDVLMTAAVVLALIGVVILVAVALHKV